MRRIEGMQEQPQLHFFGVRRVESLVAHPQ